MVRPNPGDERKTRSTKAAKPAADEAEDEAEKKPARGGPTPRAVWTGAISFGLVTIPVRLFVAVRSKTVHFRSLHDQDHVPLKQKLYCPADGADVHREHIVKGYEISKDRFVIVRQDELEAVAPKSSKAIEIQDFVALGEIDPVYFDRAYFVSPKPEGAKPYKLLLEAMSRTEKVGIAKIVMYGKEYLAALRPHEGLLMLETMHFDDEVVKGGTIPDVAAGQAVDERELRVAQQLIDSLTTGFSPDKYHDEYYDRVMEMIRRKAEGEQVVVRAEEEPASPRGQNLMAALEASLARHRAAHAKGEGRSAKHNAAAAGTGAAKRRKTAP